MTLTRALILGLVACIAGPGTSADPPPADASGKVSYYKDVRPIFAQHCNGCHQPAKAGGKVVLTSHAALLESGSPKERAVVPGKPDASELVRRTSSSDPDVHMPPPDSGLALAPAQVETLRRWVAEGARYEKHWSLLPPREPALPAVRREDWPRNPIDRFLLARLEREGFAPSPEAAAFESVVRIAGRSATWTSSKRPFPASSLSATPNSRRPKTWARRWCSRRRARRTRS